MDRALYTFGDNVLMVSLPMQLRSLSLGSSILSFNYSLSRKLERLTALTYLRLEQYLGNGPRASQLLEHSHRRGPSR